MGTSRSALRTAQKDARSLVTNPKEDWATPCLATLNAIGTQAVSRYRPKGCMART